MINGSVNRDLFTQDTASQNNTIMADRYHACQCMRIILQHATAATAFSKVNWSDYTTPEFHQYYCSVIFNFIIKTSLTSTHTISISEMKVCSTHPSIDFFKSSLTINISDDTLLVQCAAHSFFHFAFTDSILR